MPLFFFHLRTARGLEEDEAGAPFPDVEAAYIDVCRAIPEMLEELLGEGHDPMRCAFEIADERGRLLMDVPFAERLTRAAARPRPEAARAPDHAAMLDAVSSLSASTAARARALHRSIVETRREVARTAEALNGSFLDRIAQAYGVEDAEG